VKAVEISKKASLLIAVVAIIALLLPSLVSTYYVGLAVQVFIMAIFAMSLNILVGYTGLPSLGHAAYFGTAAYTTGFLYIAGIHNFWWVVGLGIVFGGLTAALFGLLALRARGAYFMLITMALSQVLWGIAFKWRSFTGGDDGLPGIKRPEIGFGIDLTPYSHFYYFAFIIFLIVLIALFILLNSPFGYVLRGIRESESRMKALGYNVWLYKYMAFLFAGLFAAVSGVLWVYYTGYVSPVNLGMDASVKALLMVILGGTGSLLGPVIGSGIIVLLENIVSGFTERWSLVLGIVYVVAIMFFSEGIFSIIKRGQQG
jgi:branched-chain amino acid transport system permease protein